MKFNFSVFNCMMQDFGVNFEVGKKHKDMFVISSQSEIKKSTKEETYLKHIKNDLYNVSCKVISILNGIVIINIDKCNFILLAQDDSSLKEGNYYTLKGEIYIDWWCTFLDDNDDKFFEILSNMTEVSGEIKNIKIDTSKYISTPKAKTKEGVEKIYNIEVEKTDFWEDEDKYADGAFDYLMEIEIDKNE